MKRKNFKNRQDVLELEKLTKMHYENKYYNLFMNSFVFSGDIEPEQADYIKRQFWVLGTVSAFEVKTAGIQVGIAFAPYTVQHWNMNDFPVDAMIVNKYNLPFIPSKVMQVDKDIVLGWILPNHKPIKEMVDYYVSRIVQVQLVINTNLNLQKIPFLIGVDPADRERMEDIVDRILANELVVFGDMTDLERLKAVITNTPYLVDKLYTYCNSLESDLMTYLGLDNVADNKKERLVVDEVNANNAVINANSEGMLNNLRVFTSKIKNVFGKDISVERLIQLSKSLHEESPTNIDMEGEAEDE